MSGILVFAEHDGGSFRKTTTELLGKGKELADQLGTTLDVAVLGDAPAAELGAYGVTKAYQVAGDFSYYDGAQVTAALAATVEAAQPDVILAAAAFAGKDAIPRLTARLGTGQGSECTDLRVEGGSVIGRRPLYAGKAYADVHIHRAPGIFTIRANSFSQPTAGSGSAEVVAVACDAAPLTSLVERKAPTSNDVDLTEAERIVSGGRSLKSKDSFDDVIRPIGEVLNATVGASRAAVDAGYAGHNEQVGQTGKTVNPSLYFAIGISGAIQHLAGMRTSKVIVAVNKDPEAPIFEHATYGLVHDLFEVCPKLVQELRAKL
jgi:electron transfer flavoprotein alpha subunit